MELNLQDAPKNSSFNSKFRQHFALYSIQSIGMIQHKTIAQHIIIMVLSNSKENKQQSQKNSVIHTHNRLQINRLMGRLYNGSVLWLTDLGTRIEPSISVLEN